MKTANKEISHCTYCYNLFSGSYFCPICGCEGSDNDHSDKKGMKTLTKKYYQNHIVKEYKEPDYHYI